MNERIRQLALQAGVQDNPDREGLVLFAELLVQECAKSLWTEECHMSDLALEEYKRNSKKIKQHFGFNYYDEIINSCRKIC
jgi:hypothetical protein